MRDFDPGAALPFCNDSSDGMIIQLNEYNIQKKKKLNPNCMIQPWIPKKKRKKIKKQNVLLWSSLGNDTSTSY